MVEDENMKNVEVIDKMMQGMGSFLSTKTVVGEPISFGDTVILPLVEVSFGMAAGTGEDDKKGKGAGGIGGRMTPAAVLVIKNGILLMLLMYILCFAKILL